MKVIGVIGLLEIGLVSSRIVAGSRGLTSVYVDNSDRNGDLQTLRCIGS